MQISFLLQSIEISVILGKLCDQPWLCVPAMTPEEHNYTMGIGTFILTGFYKTLKERGSNSSRLQTMPKSSTINTNNNSLWHFQGNHLFYNKY
jgi:hypothetical protein